MVDYGGPDIRRRALNGKVSSPEVDFDALLTGLRAEVGDHSATHPAAQIDFDALLVGLKAEPKAPGAAPAVTHAAGSPSGAAPSLAPPLGQRSRDAPSPWPPGDPQRPPINTEAMEAINAIRKPAIQEAAKSRRDQEIAELVKLPGFVLKSRRLEAQVLRQPDKEQLYEEALRRRAEPEPEPEPMRPGFRRMTPETASRMPDEAGFYFEPGAWARFTQKWKNRLNLPAHLAIKVSEVNPALAKVAEREARFRMERGLYDPEEASLEALRESIARELELGLPMYDEGAAKIQRVAYERMAEFGPKHFPHALGVWNKIASAGGDLSVLVAELAVMRKAGLNKLVGRIAPPQLAGPLALGAGFGASAALHGQDARGIAEEFQTGMMLGGIGKAAGAITKTAPQTLAGVGVGGMFAHKTAAEGGDPWDVVIAGILVPLAFHGLGMSREVARGLEKAPATADKVLGRALGAVQAGRDASAEVRRLVQGLADGTLGLSKEGRRVWRNLRKPSAEQQRLAIEAGERTQPQREPSVFEPAVEARGKEAMREAGLTPAGEQPRTQPQTQPQTQPRATEGVIVKKGVLHPNPSNPEAAREFLRQLREKAAQADQQADASTASKAARLRANARAARRDADLFENKLDRLAPKEPPDALPVRPDEEAVRRAEEAGRPAPGGEPPGVGRGKERVPPAERPAKEAAPVEILTRIPKEWQGRILYDWGQKGLRAQGNDYVRSPGERPRKTFDDLWLRDLDRIDVPNPKLLRAVKKLTEEVWPVRKRRGKFWSTAYYLAPRAMIERARAEIGKEVPAIQKQEVKGVEEEVPFMPSSSGLTQPKTMAGEGKPRVSAAQLVDMMSKAAGVPIRYGHGKFAQRKAAGWFDPGRHVIRQRVANELSTAAHEFGHAVNDKVVGWNVKWPADVKKELLAWGKELYGKRKSPAGYIREGFAEYAARLFLGDETVKGATTETATHKWFREVLKSHPEFAKEWRKIKESFEVYDQQGAAARVASQIHKIQRGPLGKLKAGYEFLSGLLARRMWTTDAAPLHDAVKKVIAETGMMNLPPDLNPAITYDVLKMAAPGTARHFIEHAAISYKPGRMPEKIGPSMTEVLTPVRHSLDDFTLYAVAKRAQHLFSRGLNPGSYSRKDAKFVVDTYETPEFKKALDGVTQWYDHLMTYLVDSGGLSPGAAKTIRALNPIYVPFKRFFDETYQGGSKGRGRRGMVNQAQAIKRLKGSGRQVEDFVDALYEHAQEIISLGNKLQMVRTIADFADLAGKSAWFAEKVPTPKEATRFKAEDIVQQLVKMGIVDPESVLRSSKGGAGIVDKDGNVIDLDQVMTVFTNASSYFGKDNIATIWRKGKREFWEFDPEVYKVITEMDKDLIAAFLNNPLGRLATKAKRGVQLGATALSPTFMGRNIFRDLLTAPIFTRAKGSKLGPLGHAAGIWDKLMKSPAWEGWSAGGGEMATLMGQDRAAARQNIQGAMAQGKFEKGGTIVRHPLQVLREVIGTGESGPRITEYKKVLAEAEKKWGVGSRAAYFEALLGSKDVTVNFTRMGVLSQMINSVVPFYNARIQGASKFYRVFSGADASGKTKMAGVTALRATARAFSYITVPNILMWWFNRDKKWYQEMEPWQKYGFLHIDTKGDGTMDGVYSIPGPFELQRVFGGLPVAMLDEWYGDYPDAVTDAMWEAFKSFLPVNTIAELAPALVKPAGEFVFNKKTFPEIRDIDPYWEVKSKLPKDRFSEWTTETGKALGELLGVSPRKIEHLIGGYTGGMGLDVMRMAEGIVGWRDMEWPLVGAVKQRSPFGRGKSVNDMYERLDQLQQQRGSKKISHVEKRELKKLQRASKRMSDIRQKQNAGRIPDDKANEQITDIARKALGRGGFGPISMAKPRRPHRPLPENLSFRDLARTA